MAKKSRRGGLLHHNQEYGKKPSTLRDVWNVFSLSLSLSFSLFLSLSLSFSLSLSLSLSLSFSLSHPLSQQYTQVLNPRQKAEIVILYTRRVLNPRQKAYAPIKC